MTMKQAINCHDNSVPQNVMGCWMFPNSEDRFSRKFIDTLDGIPSVQNGGFPRMTTDSTDIRISEPPQQPRKGSRSVMSPGWDKYQEELYRTSVLDSERRKSTGVMVNNYTGRMFECFEEDMPPPNTDKSIPREVFEHTNPRLIWANGGSIML